MAAITSKMSHTFINVFIKSFERMWNTNTKYISIKNAKNWVHKEGKEGKLTLGIVSKELHGTVELDG